ncbi:MAG TPA: PTS fructose transporter subunit IIC [Anaerolineae bacterium]|nr:PTS fructose transporter subunit IIC [Anaerolineae bacterium]
MSKKSFGTDIRKHLLNGVSYMIPFVVPGGILIAIGFLLGGIRVYETEGFAAQLFFLGKDAFGLMIAALAGYIAFSIADRPGIVPGFVGGIVAGRIGAGFFGGIIAGFLAGYFVDWLKKIHIPTLLRPLMPVLIIPLLGTTLVGLLMIYVVGPPCTWLNTTMTDLLTNLGTGSTIVLGIVLGVMMAFDMGGPVNKAAYFFGLAAMESENFVPIAAVMVAGMTPPLGVALAILVSKEKFTEEERGGLAGCFIGAASFITEFAIPYAAADPFHVIPSLMVGSAVGAVSSMLFNISMHAPHGGFFVFALADKPIQWLFSILIGGIATAVMLVILKPNLPKK